MMNEQTTEPTPTEDYSEFCVLIVEDDEIMRLSLQDRLHLEGIPVKVVSDIADAKKVLDKDDIDLVVTDIRLPDGSGSELFDHILSHHPGMPVILMTAYGEIAKAVDLVKAGALDYLTKPFDLDSFITQLRRNLSQISDLNLSLDLSHINKESLHQTRSVLGKSPSMRGIQRLIARMAKANSSILITGESGTGKEVVATLIHRNSDRASQPFITVNCAALSPNLVESELFGHEKGSFTGAIDRRIGRFEQAQGGTIFLDEIAEIKPAFQVKLLRVLQERTIERIGSGTPIELDVRVIAATQVDMDEAIKNGDFRADLFWRLNVINIHIPPLSERREDILYLARQFVDDNIAETGSSVRGLSQQAENKLLRTHFPGNVRELKNILERAVVLCNGPWIMPHDLKEQEHWDDIEGVNPTTATLRESIAKTEKQIISDTLQFNDWVIGKAAESLGISRKNLWEKIKRHGIERE